MEQGAFEDEKQKQDLEVRISNPALAQHAHTPVRSLGSAVLPARTYARRCRARRHSRLPRQRSRRPQTARVCHSPRSSPPRSRRRVHHRVSRIPRASTPSCPRRALRCALRNRRSGSGQRGGSQHRASCLHRECIVANRKSCADQRCTRTRICRRRPSRCMTPSRHHLLSPPLRRPAPPRKAVSGWTSIQK